MGLPSLSPHQEAFSAPLGWWPLAAVSTPQPKSDEGRRAGGPELATQWGSGC